MAPSGARNRYIALYSVADGAGGSGFPVESPTLLARVWASRDDVGGHERYANDQLSAPFDTKWELPYSADWDPELVDVAKKRRLVYEGRTYDIVRAERTGMKQEDIAVWTLARQG